MSAARVLLSQCIDYAGLFPPAGLDLAATVENYAAYRASSSSWALGKIILPSGWILEFAEKWPAFLTDWPIALLLRGEPEDGLRVADDAGVHAVSVECGPMFAHEIERLASAMPTSAAFYIEVDCRADPTAAIAAISRVGARAKVRTGGTTPDAISSSSDLARFLGCCVQHRVPFKATAGLHHAIRGNHALTYEQGSERASMHGFVNVLMATALLAEGGDVTAAAAMLEETSANSFRFEAEGIRWRDWSASSAHLLRVRRELMISFGSCSFTEPLEEMYSLRWLS